jgi:tetratricopeptide (TPR) repeat protein
MAKRERPRARLQRQQRRAARKTRGAGGALTAPELDDLFGVEDDDLEDDGPCDDLCDDPTCPYCHPDAGPAPRVVTPGTAVPAGALNARRAMERVHARLGRVLRRHDVGSPEEADAVLGSRLGPGGPDADAPPESDLERAQELLYDAWEQPGRRKRVSLARKALALSPDCADAYVLLAEETAGSPEAARPLYERGVAAGERALGEASFRERVGAFWHLLETRPYMRARAGLAEALWASGERDAALAHFRALLRLNPGDHQGNRYRLLAALLEAERDGEATRLLGEYREEASAAWAYGRLLLAIREGGADRPARRHLERAVRANPFVPAYLLGVQRLPRRPPAYVGMGDDAEAQDYVLSYGQAWLGTPGALDWLATAFAGLLATEFAILEATEEEETGRQRAGPPPRR